MGNIGPRSWQYGPSPCTKTAEGQYSPVRLKLARLASSLLYGTRAMLVFNLPAFENKNTQLMAISVETVRMATKKEPIRTLGFTTRLSCLTIHKILSLARDWSKKTLHMTEYSPAENGEIPRLVYTKTVDSVGRARSDWLVKLRTFCAIYLRATREKWRPSLHP